MLATLEERVAYLEGKVEEHSSAWQDLRERITHLEHALNQRISSLKQSVNERFNETNQRIIGLEQSVNQRINETNKRINRLYLLIIGTLASSIGSLIAAIISIVIQR